MRRHGGQATPITFGKKVGTWFRRRRMKLRRNLPVPLFLNAVEVRFAFFNRLINLLRRRGRNGGAWTKDQKRQQHPGSCLHADELQTRAEVMHPRYYCSIIAAAAYPRNRTRPSVR